MLAKLLETIRSEGFRKTAFFRTDLFIKDYGLAVMVADYAISKNWYQKTRHANFMVDLMMSMYLIGIGKTSVHIYNELHDAQTGEAYARVVLRMVFTDPVTHRAKALPDWLSKHPDLDLTRNLERFRDIQDITAPGWGDIPLIAQKAAKPESAYSYSVSVTPSLIDRNSHTNNTHYIRFCMDCAAEAVYSGRLSDFHGDVALYNVQRAKVFYQKETVCGDQLGVFVWPSETAMLELCFLIEKAQDAVFSCSIRFYPLASSKY